MRNNYHQELQTSKKNYGKNRRRCNAVVSAQIAQGYNDELRIREDPEADSNRE
jgi:hypothetical protein